MQSSFLHHNGLLFAGSVVVGVLNYAYYPLLGRLLTPAEFGEVQTLVSLFLQLIIFLTVLGIVGTNVVSHHSQASYRNKVFFELEKIGLLLSLGLLVFSVLLAPTFARALSFSSSWPFILLALSIVASVPLFLRIAFLRGKHDFLAVSLAQIFSSLAKLLLAWLLVFFGLGTIGAIGGLVLAQLTALVYAHLKSKGYGLTKPGEAKYFAKLQLKQISTEIKFSLYVLVASLGVIALFSIDVIIVKYFFDAQTAGLYAGVATVGRIVFFLTASVSQVLLAGIAPNRHKKNKGLLIKSLILVVGLSAPVVVLFCLFPSQVVGLLMGQEYAEVASLLPMLVVANFTISIVNLLVLYFLALRRVMVSVVAIMGFVAACVLIIVNHHSLSSVAYNLIIGSSVTLIIVLLCFARDYLKWRKNDETGINIGGSASP